MSLELSFEYVEWRQMAIVITNVLSVDSLVSSALCDYFQDFVWIVLWQVITLIKLVSWNEWPDVGLLLVLASTYKAVEQHPLRKHSYSLHILLPISSRQTVNMFTVKEDCRTTDKNYQFFSSLGLCQNTWTHALAAFDSITAGSSNADSILIKQKKIK